MKLLPTLSHAVNSSEIAPTYMHELVNWLKDNHADVVSVKKAYEDLAALNNQFKTLDGSEDLSDLLNNTSTALDSIEDILPDNLKETLAHSNIIPKLQKALGAFSVALSPISQHQDFKREIDGERKKTLNVKDIEISLGVSASAQYGLYVLDSDEFALATDMTISSNMVVLNHDLSGKAKISAGASTQINALSLSGSIEKEKELELDSYFQVSSNMPSASAIWQMLSTSFAPWELSSVADALISNDNNAIAGYRALNFRSQGTLAISGGLSLGKSLNFEENIRDKSVSVDISLAIAAKTKHLAKGIKTFRVTKNAANRLEITVALDDSKQVNTSFTAGLNTEIKGLDTLVDAQIERFLGKTDELVKNLQELSRPDDLIQEAIDNLRDGADDWVVTASKVLLGETQPNDIFKKLVIDEINDAYEQMSFSPSKSAEDLAESVYAKLVDALDADTTNLPADLVSPLEDEFKRKLAETIEPIRNGLDSKYQTYLAMLQSKAEAQLEPIAKLGESVRASLNKVQEISDQKIVPFVENIVSKYDEFKKRIDDNLKKAASVKLEAQYKHERETTNGESLSYTLEFIDANDEASQSLYQSIITGNISKSLRLTSKLEAAGLVRSKNLSRRFVSKQSASSTLSVNIFGFGFSQIKDVSSELLFEVNAAGAVNITYKYAAQAMANSKDESRKAVFNFTYGFAMASASPEFTSALGLDYVNTDTKLHRTREIRDLFDSIDVNKTLKEVEEDVQIMPLFSRNRLDMALAEYKHAKGSSNSNLFLASEIRLTMRPGEDIHESLMALKPSDVANVAVPYLVAMNNWNSRVGNIAQSTIALLMTQDKVNLSSFGKLTKYFADENPDRADIARLIKKHKSFNRVFEWVETGSSGRGKKTHFWHACRELGELFQMVQSLSLMPAILQKIDKLTRDLLAETTTQIQLAEALPRYNNALREANKEMEHALDEWVKVKGIFANSAEDFLSRFGRANAGMPYQLSCLFSVLQTMIGKGELFDGAITLQAQNKDKNKVIKI
jgi:hypothetical protein